MNEHRWSGWPGAYCQDCGIEDQTEICVGEHDLGLICAECGKERPNPVCDDPQDNHGPLKECPDHQNPPCHHE